MIGCPAATVSGTQQLEIGKAGTWTVTFPSSFPPFRFQYQFGSHGPIHYSTNEKAFTFSAVARPGYKTVTVWAEDRTGCKSTASMPVRVTGHRFSRALAIGPQGEGEGEDRRHEEADCQRQDGAVVGLARSVAVRWSANRERDAFRPEPAVRRRIPRTISCMDFESSKREGQLFAIQRLTLEKVVLKTQIRQTLRLDSLPLLSVCGGVGEMSRAPAGGGVGESGVFPAPGTDPHYHCDAVPVCGSCHLGAAHLVQPRKEPGHRVFVGRARSRRGQRHHPAPHRSPDDQHRGPDRHRRGTAGCRRTADAKLPSRLAVHPAHAQREPASQLGLYGLRQRRVLSDPVAAARRSRQTQGGEGARGSGFRRHPDTPAPRWPPCRYPAVSGSQLAGRRLLCRGHGRLRSARTALVPDGRDQRGIRSDRFLRVPRPHDRRPDGGAPV